VQTWTTIVDEATEQAAPSGFYKIAESVFNFLAVGEGIYSF